MATKSKSKSPEKVTTPEPVQEVSAPVSLSDPEPVSASDLVTPLTEGMPEPTNSPMGENPEGVETLEASPEPATASPAPAVFQAGQVDSRGTVFDPVKHMSDETGRPKTDSNGNFYSKNIGRKRKAQGGQVEGSEREPSFETTFDREAPSAPSSIASLDRFDLAAELYCRTGYGVAVTAFSDEGWQPENDSEHRALKSAVANYLRVKNQEDLPPGLALGFAVAAYAGKRVTRPKTADKLKAFWFWINLKMGRRLQVRDTEPDDSAGDEIK